MCMCGSFAKWRYCVDCNPAGTGIVEWPDIEMVEGQDGLLVAAEPMCRGIPLSQARAESTSFRGDVKCRQCLLGPSKVLRRRNPKGRRYLDLDDACIAGLPGVRFACCGHGDLTGAYLVMAHGLKQFGVGGHR